MHHRDKTAHPVTHHPAFAGRLRVQFFGFH
jgi:hypothetical protein